MYVSHGELLQLSKLLDKGSEQSFIQREQRLHSLRPASASFNSLKVFRELKIHVNLITPYKNLNLARESARSLLIAERDQDKHESRLCEVTWEEIDEQLARHEQQGLQKAASSLGIEVEPDL
jgi:hypothetical protein